MKTQTTSPIRIALLRRVSLIGPSLNRLRWRRGPFLISLAVGFATFTLSSAVRADCRSGCWNGSTFLGDDAFLFGAPYLYDTAVGGGALYYPGSGVYNVAVGWGALNINISGWENTAIGAYSMLSNTTGSYNTTTGGDAMSSNTTGSFNVANGVFALANNTDGTGNTGIGSRALGNNETGNNNTASGIDALSGNTTGSFNTATGSAALYDNVEGTSNTANGDSALLLNTTGNFNTAMGDGALLENDTGIGNTASGVLALGRNTTGSFNIALGSAAGFNLTTGDNNIDIGNEGVAAEANTIRIGTQGTQTATYIAGISGTALRGGVAVRVDEFGKLGTAPSSARFKQNIQPMDKTSEAIHALKPVTFRYKQELDPESIPQFGLVAEEVEKVNPDLVARDEQGKPYTVRYEAVNVMLLNEFLKEHRKVQKLEAALDAVNKRLKEQDVKIQKVSAQLELNKRAPQMVQNQ